MYIYIYTLFIFIFIFIYPRGTLYRTSTNTHPGTSSMKTILKHVGPSSENSGEKNNYWSLDALSQCSIIFRC